VINSSNFKIIPFKSKRNTQKNYEIDRDHTVAILGTAKSNENNQEFIKMAYDLANKLAKQGFNIVTGGGRGIMEAANRGANNVDPSKSYAILVEGWETKHDKKFFNTLAKFSTGSERTELFKDIAKYWVVFPGGPGTLQEIVLGGENKYYRKKPYPEEIVIVGKNYHEPLFKYFQNMNTMGFAKKAEGSYSIVDTEKEIIEKITKPSFVAVA